MAVKKARKVLALKHREVRETERRFLIEGLRLCEEALRANAPVEQLIFCRETLEKNERLRRLFDEAARRGIQTQQTDRRAMVHMSETPTPQGVLGVVHMPAWDRDLALSSDAPLLLLDRVRDPGNLGLILRTSEAAGAGGLFLSPGSVEVYNPKAVRASMGSIFRVPAFQGEELIPLIRDLRCRGVRLLCAQADGLSYRKVRIEGRFALVLGNEAFGIDPALAPLADEAVSIPMAGQVESLNVAVAAGILLYRFADRE